MYKILTVSEDAAVGTVIAQLKVEDADALESPYLQFFISDGDVAGKFGVRQNGEVYVRQGLDREAVSHYDLGVTVTDGVFVSETRINVDVLDANGTRLNGHQPFFSL
jgi:protocadherin Fat 1/2/3